MLISNENLDQNLFITRANGFSHNIRLLIYICCNAMHATTPADENYCKKLIYGDINELDFTSIEMKTLAQQIVATKVKELRDQCAIFIERQTNRTLTERATIYLNYLKEAIKWLECVDF